uniref:Uncharacterized protein n=1 Tax=Anguilla anguilla TaxID=7936 RepID=A0A0E9TV08_ANGAN
MVLCIANVYSENRQFYLFILICLTRRSH